MADFVQTMKDWRRMFADINCIDCEIFDCCEGLPNADADKIQRIVTAWAAEHPEPVYPSWYEYLTDMYPATWNMIKDKPIPVDIAQKLGIEPKEG
jgi:hypothetical protein